MNILILTTHYPSAVYDNKQTKMSHYFATAWLRRGHNVRVVHAVDGYFTDKTGDIAYVSSEPFFVDGVKALELAAPRYLPKFSYLLPTTYRSLAKNTIRFLDSENFTPDVMIVDFCVPLWDFALRVQKEYDCRIFPIFHNCDLDYLLSTRLVSRICDYCDVVGVRSPAIGKKVSSYGCDAEQFWVKSGVPDKLFDQPLRKKIKKNGETMRLLYAGTLIPRKNVDVTIRALSRLRYKYRFTLDIIGSGECEYSLRSLAAALEMDDIVTFRGKLSREETMDMMRQSDVFVMASSDETFGMVYVEAMAAGCYVIGSRGEGIDGVLVDGVNGTLVRPLDEDELTAAIELYLRMSLDDRCRIAERAYRDAQQLTDSAVAADLLSVAVKGR